MSKPRRNAPNRVHGQHSPMRVQIRDECRTAMEQGLDVYELMRQISYNFSVDYGVNIGQVNHIVQCEWRRLERE